MAVTTERFGWQKDEVMVSQCWKCEHWRRLGTCDAFPAGVPDEILTNIHDHRNSHPNDHGVRFDPIKKQSATEE